MRLGPLGRLQDVLGNGGRQRNVRAGRHVSVVIGHIREVDALTVGCVPLGSALGNDAADAGLLGYDVVGRFEVVLVRPVLLDLLPFGIITISFLCKLDLMCGALYVRSAALRSGQIDWRLRRPEGRSRRSENVFVYS